MIFERGLSPRSLGKKIIDPGKKTWKKTISRRQDRRSRRMRSDWFLKAARGMNVLANKEARKSWRSSMIRAWFARKRSVTSLNQAICSYHRAPHSILRQWSPTGGMYHVPQAFTLACLLRYGLMEVHQIHVKSARAEVQGYKEKFPKTCAQSLPRRNRLQDRTAGWRMDPC